MASQREYESIAEVVGEIKPFVGQDAEIEFAVYADRQKSSYKDISLWSGLEWVLLETEDALVPLTSKTLGSGITVTSPRIYVVFSCEDLDADTTYYHQLWRVESLNRYPLTGICTLVPQAGLALLTP